MRRFDLEKTFYFLERQVLEKFVVFKVDNFFEKASRYWLLIGGAKNLLDFVYIFAAEFSHEKKKRRKVHPKF
jgi:hypothetical protein